jgi:hypothetical protein
MQIPRRPIRLSRATLGIAQGRLSPRKRGSGQLGMTMAEDLAARLKLCALSKQIPNQARSPEVCYGRRAINGG